MGVYIKASNCSGGCLYSSCCVIDEYKTQSTDGPDTDTTNFDVTAQATYGLYVYVQFSIAFTGGYAQLVLKADGVEIYDSGCIDTGHSAVVTVPAGTATLTAIVTQECSGTWVENSWEYSLTCA